VVILRLLGEEFSPPMPKISNSPFKVVSDCYTTSDSINILSIGWRGVGGVEARAAMVPQLLANVS